VGFAIYTKEKKTQHCLSIVIVVRCAFIILHLGKDYDNDNDDEEKEFFFSRFLE